MPNQDSIDRRHEAQFNRWMDGEAKRFLDLLDKARSELQAEIASLESFELDRTLNLIAQIDDIERKALKDIQSTGPASTRIGDMVLQHQNESFKALGANVHLNFDIINPKTLQKFSQLELNKVKGITTDSINTIRGILFTKIGVEGESPRVVARELAGKEGLFTNNYGRLENIVRTESSTIYNAQKLETMDYANSIGVEINKKIIETIDYKRNHPISPVLNGMIQKVSEPFKVSVSSVRASARGMKRKGLSGVFWREQDGFFVGNNLPAHYMERGVIVSTMEPVTPQR